MPYLQIRVGHRDPGDDVPGRRSPAMYRVARISMVHFELKIENASTAASTSQPISKSSSLYCPNDLRIIAPASSTSETASRILLRSEEEIRMGPSGIGNRLCRSHLVYKMHLGVIMHTSWLIYRNWMISA